MSHRKRSGNWSRSNQLTLQAAIEPLEHRCLLSASPAVVPLVAPLVLPARQAEYLNRGVVAIRESSGSIGTIYISWRLLGTDSPDIRFNLYCSTNGASPVLLNTGGPLAQTTDFVQLAQINSLSHAYFVKPVDINGVEGAASETYTLGTNAPVGYIRVPLQPPPGGTTPDGEAFTYRANDTSVGDLDGDGQYEYVVKWDPTNAHDSSQAGFTGDTYFDAYKLDGTRMWRINLGKNVRAGAHYTQFIVYDLNGDGRAEVAMKTAPGTVDGLGNPVFLAGDDPNADYRNVDGRTNLGPEYITIFDGLTGANLTTTAFKPDRVNTSTWGDDYGNRQDRILMAVAYLDGQHPSLVFGRGLFPGQNSSHAVRNEITAWDWNGSTLNLRWWFKADKNASSFGIPDVNTNYIGQGNYEMHVADVDGDGKDEIIFGSMTINSNGTPRYSTGLGHGDALHVSDMDPTRPGEEIYMPMESPGSNGHITTNTHDASTGQVLFSTLTTPVGSADPDVGRGVAFDVDPRYTGYEAWDSYNAGMYNVSGSGSQIQSNKPSGMPINFGIWWDADPLRELEDGSNNDSNTGGSPTIKKYDWNNNLATTIFSASGTYSNNNTKATPMLVADILGDWREELLVRSTDNTEMRIYSTTIQATNRIYTLMDDIQYREAIAWQNVGYNQPPHPSFFLGAASYDSNTGAMTFPTIPAANIYTVQNTGLPPLPPANVVASVGGLNQLNISWSSAAGATSYNVKRATSINGTYTTIAPNVVGTTYTDNSVTNGTTYYYAITTVNGAAQESYKSSQIAGKVPIPNNGSVVYQAEDAVFGLDSFFENTNNGYVNKGYVNFPSTGTTGYLEFDNVYGGAGGTSNLTFRYAFNATKSGSLIVNGVTQAITFNTTGSLTAWGTLTVPVTLNAGTANTIRLQVTGADLPNVDQLQVDYNGESVAPTITLNSHTFATSPNKLNFTFSEAVNPSADLSDLIVTRLADNQVITPTAFIYNTGTQIATFTLPAGLADGNYRVSFVTGGVIDGFGNTLSNTYSYDFFVLGGDANHDRWVDLSDMIVFGANWLLKNRNFSQGDFNYDGSVDAKDLTIVAHNWQAHLDPPASAPPVLAPPIDIVPAGPAPVTTTTTYLSDLMAASATNGWGAYEKDRSNGEAGSHDGRAITLNGQTYDKGLGVHAGSTIVYNLDGKYTQFLADIGVDDEVGSRGSVIFQVYADNKKIYDSSKMTGSSVTKSVTLDVSGVKQLKLVVTDSGNGRDFDHADWANARLLWQQDSNVSIAAATSNTSDKRTDKLADLVSTVPV